MSDDRKGTPEFFRAVTALAIKRICAKCKDAHMVTECETTGCPFHPFINSLHNQRLWDTTALAASVCQWCFNLCGPTFPICQNYQLASAQCLMFYAKESAKTVSSSKTKFDFEANHVTRRGE